MPYHLWTLLFELGLLQLTSSTLTVKLIGGDVAVTAPVSKALVFSIFSVF